MVSNNSSNGMLFCVSVVKKEMRIRVVVTNEGKSKEQTERPSRGV
jgi:hypothetical protein